MNPVVSVIVPVYNSAAYVERCVQAILAQTFQQFELILIDDGSTDASGKICDMFEAQDPRIHAVHQGNQGAAAARNAGLDLAKGEYVTFCDSDDQVSHQWLERMMQYAAPDTLAMGSYCQSHQQLGKIKALAAEAGSHYFVQDYWIFHQSGIAGYLCNALYHNETIQRNHLRLRCQHSKGDYNEDLLFNLSYMAHMRQVVYTGYSDYLYDPHPDSLSHRFPDRYFEKYAEKYRLWKDFLQRHNAHNHIPELAEEMIYHFLQALGTSDFPQFRTMVLNKTTQDCLSHGSFPKENPAIIKLLRKKSVLSLWLRYQIHNLKGRLL